MSIPHEDRIASPYRKRHSRTSYKPFYAEESFIAQLYGTDEEVARFETLMERPHDRDNIVEIILLIETIKQRQKLAMDWQCCWRCQKFATCEINWRRGELGLPKHCCPNCQNYAECNKIYKAQKALGDTTQPYFPPCMSDLPPGEAPQPVSCGHDHSHEAGRYRPSGEWPSARGPSNGSGRGNGSSKG